MRDHSEDVPIGSAPEPAATSPMRDVRWNLVGQGGVQAIRLLSTLTLACFLAPADFGLMAMAWVVTGLLEMFIDLGTGQALIQRRTIDRDLVSTVLFANVGIGVAAALAVWFGAGAIAAGFAEPRLADVLVSIAPVFVLSALCVVHASLLQRDLRFAGFAKVRLLGAVVNGGVAIGCAAAGLGVWAMVAGYWAGTVAAVLGFWVASTFRPRLHFAWADLRRVANFSVNLSLTNAANYAFGQADVWIVGRFLGAESLGIYALAKKVVHQPTHAIGGAVSNVLFARFSRLQDDHAAIRSLFSSATQGLTLFLYPALVGLALVAAPALAAFADPRWSAVAPLLVLLVPAGLLTSIMLPTGALFRATDRTDLLLRWGITRSLIVTTGFAVGAAFLRSPAGVAFGYSIALAIALWPTLALSGRLVGMPVRTVLAAVAPIAVASAVMAGAVLGGVQLLDALGGPLPPAVDLGARVGIGVIAFVSTVLVLRPPAVVALLASSGRMRCSPRDPVSAASEVARS